MKWFKHYSDMLEDAFIVELIDEGGAEWFGIWCGILEIYARECENNPGGIIEIPLSIIKRKLRISQRKLEKVLNFCREKNKISSEINPKNVQMQIPKMQELRDEYASRKKPKSGVTRDKLPPKTNKQTELKNKEIKNSPTHREDLSEEILVSLCVEKIISSKNDNIKTFGFAEALIPDAVKRMGAERPEMSHGDIFDCWTDTCDLAVQQNVKSPKWYKTTFNNKLGDFQPVKRKDGKPKKDTLERLQEKCKTRNLDQVISMETGKTYWVHDLSWLTPMPGQQRDKVIDQSSEDEIPVGFLRPHKPTNADEFKVLKVKK